MHSLIQPRLKRYSGFTLIEFILVIAITGIIAGTAGLLLMEGFQTSYKVVDIIKADWQARIALERMTREMRLIRNKNSINISVPNQITFVTTRGETITYSRSGTNLMRNSQPLADNVSSFTLTYFNVNKVPTAIANQVRFILIHLTIDNEGATYSFDTTVNPRNVR